MDNQYNILYNIDLNKNMNNQTNNITINNMSEEYIDNYIDEIANNSCENNSSSNDLSSNTVSYSKTTGTNANINTNINKNNNTKRKIFVTTRSSAEDNKLNDLILKYQNTANNNDYSTDIIFEQIYNLYKNKFNRVSVRMNNEDISQELSIALFNAVRTFNTKYLAKFNTYFWKVARNYIGTLKIKDNAKKRIGKQILYLDQPINFDGEEVMLGDIIEDPSMENQFDDIILDEFLEKELYNQISEADVQIFKLYLQGYTITEISQLLDTTVINIFTRIKRIKQLKPFINKLLEYFPNSVNATSTPQRRRNTSDQLTDNIARMIKEKLAYGY